MSKTIISKLPLISILLVLIALIVYLQWPEAVQEKKKHQRIVSVKTTKVKVAEFKDVVKALGTTRANEQVEITTKYSDLVDDISFNDGQRVKKGDVLVQLNNQEAKGKVRELQANLAESEAQLNRFQDLLARNATSRSLVDEQEAKTKAISAQLSTAQTILNSLTIKAPFDGILGFRQISVGAFVNSGDIITSLDDLSKVKVDFSVPERFLTTLNIGQTITAISTAYRNEIFVGKISSIDSRIDAITRTLKVRAEIDNQDFKLRPGMLLNVSIERQVDTVLQLPESAIIPIENDHFIFVVEQDKAKKVSVKIGRRQPGIVEIISGVSAGSVVVIEGALKLRNGSSVKVLQEK